MRLSRSFAVSMFLGAALSLAACGGSDGKSGPDAPSGGDDAPVVQDAPTNTPAQGLGKVCTMPTDCPTGAPICAKLSQTAATGFCTLSCGTSPVPAQGTQPTPPAGGDAICTGSTPPPGAGTPGCFLTGAAQNNMIPWACGIACGTVSGQDLGGCPGGLTCDMTNNLCL